MMGHMWRCKMRPICYAVHIKLFSLYSFIAKKTIITSSTPDTFFRTNMIERALQQITSIPTIQLFLRYVLCLRHVTLPRYKLFAISNQPDLNLYRWVYKKFTEIKLFTKMDSLLDFPSILRCSGCVNFSSDLSFDEYDICVNNWNFLLVVVQQACDCLSLKSELSHSNVLASDRGAFYW